MNPVLKALEEYARRLGWGHASQALLVAVSGGVDSMVLLTALHQLCQRKAYQGLRPYTVHFNHRLRDLEIVEEEGRMVMSYSYNLGIPVHYGRWDRPTTKNVEENARKARYNYFLEAARCVSSKHILTGHHQNDQVETYLMRLIRGTSLRGMPGIRPSAYRQDVTYHRPLLQVTRQEIEDFAKTYEVPFSHDASNDLDIYFRNRVRHSYLPQLEKENPKFLDAVSQRQQLLGVSYDLHLENFQQEASCWLTKEEERVQLQLQPFVSWSTAKQEIYLHLLFEELLVPWIPDYKKGLIHELWDLMTSATRPSGSLDLGRGWIAQRNYETVTIERSTNREDSREDEVDWALLDQWQALDPHTEIFVTQQKCPQENYTDAYYFDEKLLPRLRLRHPQTGDRLRFYPRAGSPFTKTLRRFFIDEKTPRHERCRQWVLIDPDQEILWVLGTRFKVKQKEKSCQILFRKTQD